MKNTQTTRPYNPILDDPTASTVSFKQESETTYIVSRLRAIADDYAEPAQPILIEAADEIEKLHSAADGIGRWLSAALEDPKVCPEMKEDIEAWMEATE